MTISAEVTGTTGIGSRTAHVLAQPEVWSPALTGSLEGLGLDVATYTELHDLFEAARQENVSILVLAQHNTVFAVRACRVIRDLQDAAVMAVIQRDGDLIPVLDAGADDAVVARVDPAVFAARIRALLRRTNPTARSGMLTIRDLAIDLEKYQASLDGKPLPLTPTEFRLLAVLAQQAGRVVDPRSLLSAVHQHDYSERDAQNLVKVHIANLRRKMNDSRSSSPYILCVRGFGYMLERRSHIRDDDPIQRLLDGE